MSQDKPRKKPRRQKMPTLRFADLEGVIKLDGWYEVEGTKHAAYKHPTKDGKVNLDRKWTGVKVGGWICNAVCQQASLTRDDFEALYWKSR